MSMNTNDWIWARLSARYGVTAPTYQVGDVFKSWLDETAQTWGYSLVDFYASKNVAGTTFGDGAYNYWSGGALANATFWIDAFSASGTDVKNLGSGGTALNARYGSTAGVDISDPVLLPHTGTNYLYLPGTASNYASVPSITAYDITGDLEVEVDIAFTTLTPASSSYILAREGADPNRAWSFYLTSSGSLGFRWCPTGSSASLIAKSSTATLTSVGITAGQRVSVKAVLDVDNGAAGNDVKFYYSTDKGVTFTQLGTTVTTAGVTSLPVVTQSIIFNSSLGGTELDAKIYRGIVRNGIGGTVVFDANFTAGITSGSQVTFTESSVNAATVTINRAVSGRKSVAVTRPVWLFGTDDYMEIAADPYGAKVTTTGAAGSYVGQTFITYVTSTATAGAASTLDDTTQAWTVNNYNDFTVRITGGTGAGQIRRIASNTATQITVASAWTVIPDATSTYTIESNGNIEGDIEIVVRCSMADWTQAAKFVTKPFSGLGSYSFYKEIGSIRFAFATAAAPATPNTTIIAWNPTFSANTIVWMRATRVASTGLITLQWAADQVTEPTTWTTIGTNTSAIGQTVSNTSSIRFGETTNGAIYRAIVRSGVGGTAVADWAAYGHPSTGGAYRDAARNYWTLTAATVSNANPLNFGLTDSFTLVAVLRQWGNPTSFARIVWKPGYASTYGLLNYNANGKAYFTVTDTGFLGTNTAGAATTFTMGNITVITGVRNVVTDQLSHYYNNTLAGGPNTDATTDTVSNMSPLTIGGSGAGTYNDFELLAVAVIPKALTTDEIARIVAAYQ